MKDIINIKVKDQYSNILDAQALLRVASDNVQSLFHRIEHIIVAGEKIRPSIELLFESRESDSIYRVLV